MKINRDNYEEYFLDFMEGNLSPEKSEELSLFLEQNFDLKEEFEQIVFVSVKPDDSIKFSAKEILKKKEISLINESNYNNFLAAYAEGNLSAEKIERLNVFLRGKPKYQKEFNAISKSKLVPDLNIVFEEKKSLKHFEIPFYKNVYAYVSVAATVLLVFGIYLITNNIKSTFSEKYTAHNTVNKKPAKKVKPASKNEPRRIKSYTINNKPLIVKSDKPKVLNNAETQVNKTANNKKTNESIASLNINRINSKENIIRIKPNDIAPQFINNDNENVILPVNTDKNVQDNTAGKKLTLDNLYKKTAALFSGKRNKENKNKSIEQNTKANLWDMAFVGLKGYNRVFHKNIDMERKYYDNGNLASVVIKTEKFEYAKHYKEK